MGKPTCGHAHVSRSAGGAPGELKHLSTPRRRNHRETGSSGERTRSSPNRATLNGFASYARSGLYGLAWRRANGSAMITHADGNDLERSAGGSESLVLEGVRTGCRDREYHGGRVSPWEAGATTLQD